LRVNRKFNQVVVEGVNLKYKREPDQEMVQRIKVLKREAPIHVSNVSLIDPSLGIPTRVRTGYLEDGTKVRVSKKSGSVIPKPDRSELTYFARTKDLKPGPNDTKPELVMKKTYAGEDFLRVFNDFEKYLEDKAALEAKLVFKEDDTHRRKL